MCLDAMALRKCPRHGWIETEGYKPRASDGELVCKECGSVVMNYKPVRVH